MNKLLCPSMMCANYKNLKKEVSDLENAGADIFHLDIMDGNFVSNIGMGMQDVQTICSLAKIPTDVHLMMNNPGRYIKKFAQAGVSIIYIHPQTEWQPIQTFQEMAKYNIKRGLAINPEIGADIFSPILSIIDYVLVMSVVPGFAGQKYLKFVDDKIFNLINLRKENNYNYKIIIDGACSNEIIEQYSKIGVDGFILGTSSLFGKEKTYAQIIKSLRSL